MREDLGANSSELRTLLLSSCHWHTQGLSPFSFPILSSPAHTSTALDPRCPTKHTTSSSPAVRPPLLPSSLSSEPADPHTHTHTRSGGAAGLVLASRLASASPAPSILVIESGPPTTKDDPLHTQPARYFHHLRPDSRTIHFHVARPSEALRGHAPVVPCGRCVGGGSSVNCECLSA